MGLALIGVWPKVAVWPGPGGGVGSHMAHHSELLLLIHRPGCDVASQSGSNYPLR